MRRVPTAMKSQAGLSLVELMVALTIGLLILSGLTLVFVNSSEANRELQKTAQQVENGRYAADILAQDLKHAGFYGHFHEGLPAPAALPDPCDVTTAKLYEAWPIRCRDTERPLWRYGPTFPPRPAMMRC